MHMSEWSQGFTLTKNIGRDFILCSTPPHGEVVRVDENYAVGRVEVRLQPFLTSAVDTLSVHWERCGWCERSSKGKKVTACACLPSRELLDRPTAGTCCIKCWGNVDLKRYFLVPAENLTPVSSPVAGFFAR
jgi:hypothetical protein